MCLEVAGGTWCTGALAKAKECVAVDFCRSSVVGSQGDDDDARAACGGVPIE
jgi:hypothetical protein